LSKSFKPGRTGADFNEWLAREFADGSFTALIVLVSIGGLEVIPLRSTFMHVIGDELDWLAFSDAMRGAGVNWEGVVIMPFRDEDGAHASDIKARDALRLLDKRIIEDRLVINEGHFFDKWGRRMKIEEASAQ